MHTGRWTLDTKHRRIEKIKVLYQQGLTYEEIAQKVGVSRALVIHRVRELRAAGVLEHRKSSAGLVIDGELLYEYDQLARPLGITAQALIKKVLRIVARDNLLKALEIE